MVSIAVPAAIFMTGLYISERRSRPSMGRHHPKTTIHHI